MQLSAVFSQLWVDTYTSDRRVRQLTRPASEQAKRIQLGFYCRSKCKSIRNRPVSNISMAPKGFRGDRSRESKASSGDAAVAVLTAAVGHLRLAYEQC